MTFATLASWQGWLLLLGAGAIAAALFLIKLRPPRILIPSLSLWQRVLDASPDVTRWEKIRRAVSLIVTVAIAIALGLAVVRPSRLAGAGAAGRGRTLIVLDSSWSMLAKTRGRETRWDRAIAEARRIAATTEQVAIATTADGLVQGLTDDAVLVESALGTTLARRVRRYVVAGGVRRRIRALHYRRRRGPASRCVNRRPFRFRAGWQRRDHRV